jgi:CheY-like chemotaxis protein
MTSKRRILCVDGNDDTCDLISTILSDYEVVSAHSKAEGLRTATGGMFDLYLLDYYLPDGTGLELCLLIRQFDDSTPVLFLTEIGDLSEQQIQSVNAQGRVGKYKIIDTLPLAVSNTLLKAVGMS